MRPPCSAGSRWRRYALTEADVGRAVTVAGGLLRVDGAVRTELEPGAPLCVTLTTGRKTNDECSGFRYRE